MWTIILVRGNLGLAISAVVEAIAVNARFECTSCASVGALATGWSSLIALGCVSLAGFSKADVERGLPLLVASCRVDSPHETSYDFVEHTVSFVDTS